ncbi:MAG: enoyl-CoA hydratase/isomerase family protein [Paucibacter sp.]|nr:enoyl-CoA hydratase/isomerase family protein [Roseateles sp.]
MALAQYLAARGVARLTLDRPEVFNAFDEALIAELTEAFTRLGTEPAVRVVVLDGAGKHFCAGADVQWMRRAAQSPLEWNEEDAGRFAAMMAAISGCPKPTVALVHGLALGGGVGLIAACDFAIATPEAQFAVSEARLGLIPAVIAPYLVNAVGLRQARRLGLTGARIDADQALRIGLVHEVAEDSEAALSRWLDELLACGPVAQAELKRLFAQLAVGPVTPEMRTLTAQTIARMRLGDEAREGFAAFLGKRAPNWKNPT